MIAAILLLLFGLHCALITLNAIRPARNPVLLGMSWLAAWITIELAPQLVLVNVVITGILVALGALGETVGVIGLALVAGSSVVGLVYTWQAARATVTTRTTLEEIGPGGDHPESPRGVPTSHILFPWLMFRAKGVTVERGVVYHTLPSGRPIKLDIYRPDRPASGLRPAIVQVHGGAWVLGSRKEQGIPLLNHLARNGWVGFNIDYRLSPMATWPDHVVDVKRAIAWVREHAEELGVDPDCIAITGGSAGGHLSALAAVTANDPAFQPGFEDADTSVVAGVPFYGVYDFVDEDEIYPKLARWLVENLVFKREFDLDHEPFRLASPTHRVHPDVPPMLVIHGRRDSLVPVSDARAFAERLRAVSQEAVLYMEMPGAEHAFDVFPTVRTRPVVETIERFLASVRAGSPDVEREVAAQAE